MSNDNTALAVTPKPAMQLVRPIAPLADLLSARSELVTVIPKVLEEGVDFGKVPGTDKNCLMKAGAERVCIIFGAHPEYEIIEQEIDHDRETTVKTGWVEAPEPANRNTRDRMKDEGKGRSRKVNGQWVWFEPGDGTETYLGLYRYLVRCRIVRQDGLVVGDSVGSCSTLESKYFTRPRDCENTVLKMAQKRAFVGAVLNAFGLSDRFTQDLEDGASDIETPFDKPKATTSKAPPAAPPKEAAPPKDDAPKQAPPKAPPAANRSASTIVLEHCARIDACTSVDDLTALTDGARGVIDGLPVRAKAMVFALEEKSFALLGGQEWVASPENAVALKDLEKLRAPPTTQAPAPTQAVLVPEVVDDNDRDGPGKSAGNTARGAA